MTLPETLPEVFRVVDLSGVLLNGILGGLIARRKNFDVVGFVVLAILTATAGGILRDVMIQAGPPFALTDPYYLYTACVGALVAWYARFESRPARRLLVVADAIVLGTWAATGAYKALNAGLGVMPALLLGCITAVGGSMIRDVAVGETPAVFGGNKLYAIPAFCAALVQVILVRSGGNSDLALLAATCVGAGLCLLAYWRSWKLPVVSDRERRRMERQVAEAVGPARLGVLRRRRRGAVERTVLEGSELDGMGAERTGLGRDAGDAEGQVSEG
ncbi:Predicted membrane protein [Actinomyces bovis]|uniref:Predicted membrane protein n=1 Tax=Actinomyces bovis TaxID=1658 RepID=A0ABY1VPJ8_9ACTO|nr:trimeric intracellular cation channel family protein [Actinomyces bovis]SPT53597.1 Predicted membrane protein [Actinomyces bovis]VEG55625.1 Predicted membrane protein [Actinomyces israelii]